MARQSSVGVRSPAGVMESREKSGSRPVQALLLFGHSGFQPKKMKPSEPEARLIAAFLTIEAEASHSSLTRPGHEPRETKPGLCSFTACATVSAGIGRSAS